MNDSYESSLIDSQAYQIEQLEIERDQLKARVAELEGTAARTFPKRPIAVDGCIMFQVDDYNEMIDCFNNRTPAQSLNRVKAEALSWARDQMFEDLDASDRYSLGTIGGWLTVNANRLEQEVSDEAV